jgi:hypothetical protein
MIKDARLGAETILRGQVSSFKPKREGFSGQKEPGWREVYSPRLDRRTQC